MISTCTFSKLHFWGSSRISVAAKRPLIHPRFIEPFSARISHHGLRPSRAIAFSGGSWNLSRPAISPRSAASHHSRFIEPFSARRSHHGLLPPRVIAFSGGSWNLSRPADLTTVCGHIIQWRFIEPF